MKDKIQIEEYHRNHIRVKLRDHLIKKKNQSKSSQNLDKSITKKKNFNYKDVLNNVAR